MATRKPLYLDLTTGNKNQVDRTSDKMEGDDYLEELANAEETSKHYLRCNQSFDQMYYDDFSTTDKTNAGMIAKVNVNTYRMTAGNAGTWESKQWTANATKTVAKLLWRADSTFDHNIDISFDNGGNYTSISVAGATTNLDKEVSVSNTGTHVILKVSGGTLGHLIDYVLLVK